MKLEFLASGAPDLHLIRLFDFRMSEALRLREVFNRLATGSLMGTSLEEEVEIEAIGGCQLDLRVGRRDCGVLQTSPLGFECVLTADRWSDAAYLMDPFCESEKPGGTYQWLNEDGPISLLLSPDGSW
jgi:hypothetical protein